MRPKKRSFVVATGVFTGFLKGDSYVRAQGSRSRCTHWASRGEDDHRKVGVSWGSEMKIAQKEYLEAEIY